MKERFTFHRHYNGSEWYFIFGYTLEPPYFYGHFGYCSFSFTWRRP